MHREANFKARDVWCPCKLVHWEGEGYENVVNNNGERRDYRIPAYLSFVQHNNPEALCSMEVTFCCCYFDTNISFADLE